MDTQNQASPPQGAARIIGGLVQHAQTWGKVWFGLIFWGCVLYAVSQRIWPEANNAPICNQFNSWAFEWHLCAYTGVWLMSLDETLFDLSLKQNEQ